MKKILKIGDKIYAQSLQNFSPSYLTGFPQREQFLLEHVKEVEFHFFKHNKIQSLEDVFKQKEVLKDYLLTNNFDLLMIDNPLSGLLIDSNCTIPILFDSIDWYSDMYKKEFGINKTYYLLQYGLLHVLNIADRVISQSPINLNALLHLGLKTKKTIVVPNGYDRRYFYPYSNLKINKLKECFSQQYNIDLKRKKIIVYTGKLGKWYEDIKIIIQAIQNDQVLFIVGDGPLFKEIPNLGNIIKCGAIDFIKVPEYTNIADVLVFPVSIDCSPIAISEYLAVGKPIVMGYGRIEWLLKNGKSGCLVKNNIVSWKQGIENAIEMKDISKKYNLNLAKNLSWQILAKRFTDFINLN